MYVSYQASIEVNFNYLHNLVFLSYSVVILLRYILFYDVLWFSLKMEKRKHLLSPARDKIHFLHGAKMHAWPRCAVTNCSNFMLRVFAREKLISPVWISCCYEKCEKDLNLRFKYKKCEKDLVYFLVYFRNFVLVKYTTASSEKKNSSISWKIRSTIIKISFNSYQNEEKKCEKNECIQLKVWR